VPMPISTIRRQLWRLAMCGLFVLLTSSGLLADPPLGRVAGTVLDPQGAAASGATVALLNAAGTTVRSVVSDARGHFVIEGISAGSYQLSADAPSYVTAISNVGVTGGQREVTLQFRQIASSIQAMTVVASAPSSVSPDPAQTIVVHEGRGAILRPFLEERMSLAVNFLITRGYTGQTTETLALPNEPDPIERVVGVALKSYVGLSWTYYFKH
jgi:Carboxypeptidase regulatory-like domain